MRKPVKKKRDPSKIAARYNAEIEMVYRNYVQVLEIISVWYSYNPERTLQRLADIGQNHHSWSWAEVARFYLKKYFKEDWKELKKKNNL